MGRGTIPDYVERCLDAFNNLVEATVTYSPFPISHSGKDASVVNNFRDEQTRFRIWSRNIAAHKTGMSSLEYRLRDASQIKSQVIRLLQDLEGLINDCSAIFSGEKIPWDQLPKKEPLPGSEGHDKFNHDPEDEEGTEIEQISGDITDAVNCLLRLSITIRNPAPHDRFMKSRETDTSAFEPFDIQHVESKFSSLRGTTIASRLGKAISRRRQYFRYREAHHTRLARGLEGGPDDENKAQSTIASSIPDQFKERPTSGVQVVGGDDSSDAGISQTSYATSLADAESLRVPPLLPDAKKGPFECPFCYMIINTPTRIAWKRHVYSDLRPYTCLAPDCLTPEREFARRHEWTEHMRQSHFHTYKCPYGCDAVLSSAAECKDHLKRRHLSGSGIHAELESMIKLAEHPLDFCVGIPCPLCGENLYSISQYQSHVGRHQEQLALFALPLVDSGESGGEDEAKSDLEHSSVELSSVDSVDQMEQAEPVKNLEKYVQKFGEAHTGEKAGEKRARETHVKKRRWVWIWQCCKCPEFIKIQDECCTNCRHSRCAYCKGLRLPSS